jgi:hypothetical protein
MISDKDMVEALFNGAKQTATDAVASYNGSDHKVFGLGVLVGDGKIYVDVIFRIKPSNSIPDGGVVYNEEKGHPASAEPLI